MFDFVRGGLEPTIFNRSCVIYQYSSMAPRLLGSQASMFCVIFIKITSLTRKPRSHVRILIYGTCNMEGKGLFSVIYLS